MQANIFEALHVDPDEQISLADLMSLSGFSEQDLCDLVDCGALVPHSFSDSWAFKSECVITIKKAKRLRDDFELHSAALGLVLTLLQRIDGLEKEIRNLHARLPTLE